MDRTSHNDSAGGSRHDRPALLCSIILEFTVVMLQSLDAGFHAAAASVHFPHRSNVSLSADNVISEYILVCEASCSSLIEGYWQFSLETADGEAVFSAFDNEPGDLNRLTLLAAVRGLEAIEGASSVTLISNNRYLIRSLTDSLPRWRENNFVWEHFGRRIDVQHADLWRRVDRALKIHRVEACLVSSRLVSPRPVSNDSTSASVDSTPALPSAKQPADRLRQWLLGGGASTGNAPARRRLCTADLLDS